MYIIYYLPNACTLHNSSYQSSQESSAEHLPIKQNNKTFKQIHSIGTKDEAEQSKYSSKGAWKKSIHTARIIKLLCNPQPTVDPWRAFLLNPRGVQRGIMSASNLCRLARTASRASRIRKLFRSGEWMEGGARPLYSRIKASRTDLFEILSFEILSRSETFFRWGSSFLRCIIF